MCGCGVNEEMPRRRMLVCVYMGEEADGDTFWGVILMMMRLIVIVVSKL